MDMALGGNAGTQSEGTGLARRAWNRQLHRVLITAPSRSHGVTATMQVFGHLTPIQAFNDHDKLIANRPSDYSKGRAEVEAHYLWNEYVKRWFPDEYAKIPKGRQVLFSNDVNTLMSAALPVIDGEMHWPIVKFNREAEEDDDDKEDDDDEDLEVITSGEQRSDPLLDSGSDHSSNGSQG